jgi:GNAT superfamily N-acetyltransferase
MLVIPTSRDLMKQFISKKINEQELLFTTPLRTKYDALYLCSALVLPEHRGKGYARQLTIKAIKSIQKHHPIKYLFYWAFSAAGKNLAESVAKECGLPLSRMKS